MEYRLAIDGVVSGLRVRYATRFLQRLVGFWPEPRRHACDVVVFPRCNAVHTWAMRAPIDVVFADREGRVVQIVPQVAAWSVLRDPRASVVVEFRSGVTRALGIERGVALGWVPAGAATQSAAESSAARRGERGSTLIEFLLAVTLVLLPLIGGVLEFAQLAVARQVLAQATADAARSSAIAIMDAGGEVDEIDDPVSIRASLARGLLPMLGGPATEVSAWTSTLLEVMRPDLLQLQIERDVVESSDVVVDRLQVTYCRELFFVPTRYVLPPLMQLWISSPAEGICLMAGRMPLTASALATRSRYP